MINDHTVDPTLCAAYGCPCKGAMNSSTSGTDKWFCGYHYGRDGISWQKVTAELNRLSFIVTAMQSINESAGREEWPKVYRSIQQELQINQRGDLLRAETESLAKWYRRLDSELQNACQGTKPPPELALTPAKPETEGVADSWQRASFQVPEHA